MWREVARADDLAVAGVEHPRGTFFETLVVDRDAGARQVVDHVADDVAVGAERRRFARDLLEQPERVGERRALGERVGQLEGKAQPLRQRVEGLAASYVRARDDLLHSRVDQGIGDAVRLASADGRQGPEVVVVVPGTTAPALPWRTR